MVEKHCASSKEKKLCKTEEFLGLLACEAEHDSLVILHFQPFWGYGFLQKELL